MFRLRCVAFATAVVAVAVAVSLSVPANVGATNVLTVGLPAQRVVTFSEASGEVDNPERGLSPPIESFAAHSLADYRGTGVSIIRANGRLDPYRAQDLPPSLLELFDARMAQVRAAGLKLILRFSYNEGPYPVAEPDASLDWIKRHIAQLKPYLHKHGDVIAWMEAGFIGAWGEWHSSTNGLDHNPQAKREVLDALLDAVPPTRSVLLRSPADLAVLAEGPGRGGRLRRGPKVSRVGHHNDCFLASELDAGTYGRGRRSIAQDKAMIADFGRVAPIGGETCMVNQPRSGCATALQELALLGFSELNIGYHPGVLDGWRAGGCFETIRSRLGYRLFVETVVLPQVLVTGQQARLTVRIRNSGFAAPLTARPVFLVLEGPQLHMVKLPVDPRDWSPGRSHDVDVSADLPPDLAAGQYTMALWMPDASERLRTDPRYAVRLANDGAWDGAAGYNRLIADIPVRAPADRQQPKVVAELR